MNTFDQYTRANAQMNRVFGHDAKRPTDLINKDVTETLI